MTEKNPTLLRRTDAPTFKFHCHCTPDHIFRKLFIEKLNSVVGSALWMPDNYFYKLISLSNRHIGNRF